MPPSRNKLADEKSPYLLQHARNPVHWFPWGEEAFDEARKSDRPIFLSVGYSTCYWCHVMEREVFENEELASLMNETLVSVKVDREERPDVDRIYMSAVQAMTGAGGWPMSVFLNHDLRPFFGTTYIPPVPRHGRPGFGDVVRRVHEMWTTRRNELHEAAGRVFDVVSRTLPPPTGSIPFDDTILTEGFRAFDRTFDEENGGFGSAPKFPRPVALAFLLRHWARTGEERALHVVLHTLRRMGAGGIFDHLAGGIHRYSTDAQWRLPHFEKMLYDQALIVPVFLDAYAITGEKEFRSAAESTLEYVDRRLRTVEGLFTSAEDAESVDASDPHALRKREGAFYCWKHEEVVRVLGPQTSDLFCEAYDVRVEGNVQPDPQGEFGGLNILRRVMSDRELASRQGMTEADVEAVLDDARLRLRKVRDSRPHPHHDDKVIAAWNGMMISALARSSAVLGREEFAQRGLECASTMHELLYDTGAKILYRRLREGERRVHAMLDDFAWLLRGNLDLYEVTGEQDCLRRCRLYADGAVERFLEESGKGFFDTDGRDSSLIIRSKEWYDGAEPSANSVMALGLRRLGEITQSSEYLRISENTLIAFENALRQAPEAVPHFLSALDQYLGPAQHIVVAVGTSIRKTEDWNRMIGSAYIPRAVVVRVSNSSGPPGELSAAPYLSAISGEKPGVYVCEDYSCRLPARTSEEVRDALRTLARTRPGGGQE